MGIHVGRLTALFFQALCLLLGDGCFLPTFGHFASYCPRYILGGSIFQFHTVEICPVLLASKTGHKIMNGFAAQFFDDVLGDVGPPLPNALQFLKEGLG